jgi:periplasmic divalent cation tolerance protein
MMQNQYVVVLVTAPTKSLAEQIAKTLLDQDLIACANLMAPVQSCYTWQGETKADEEVLMLLKTRADLFSDKLVPAIQALHPYEVAEIIALPILMGAPDYLDWIDEVTNK